MEERRGGSKAEGCWGMGRVERRGRQGREWKERKTKAGSLSVERSVRVFVLFFRYLGRQIF